MKKAICFILTLLLFLFSSCSKAASQAEITTDPQPQSSTQQTTEPSVQTTPTTQEPTLPTDISTFGFLLSSFCKENARMHITDLKNGWSMEDSDRSFLPLIEGIDWSRATYDGSSMFLDAQYEVRLENPETGWSVRVTDGADAAYAYLSEYEVYVPLTVDGADATDYIHERVRSIADNTINRTSPDRQVRYEPDATLVADVATVSYSEDILLPQIELPGENIERINEEILRDFTPKNDPALYRISFDANTAEDILSLRIVYASTQDDFVDYRVYNICISECRLLSHDEFYNKMGIETPEISVRHAIAMTGGACRTETERIKEINFEHTPTGALPMFEYDLSDECYQRSLPYLDSNNEIRILCFIDIISNDAGHIFKDIRLADYEADVLYTAEEYYDYFLNQ